MSHDVADGDSETIDDDVAVRTSTSSSRCGQRGRRRDYGEKLSHVADPGNRIGLISATPIDRPAARSVMRPRLNESRREPAS